MTLVKKKINFKAKLVYGENCDFYPRWYVRTTRV
jgi:hypothetical protein